VTKTNTLPLITLIKRIFTDLQRKRMDQKGGANLTRTTSMGQSKTLPLIMLMKWIFTDLQRKRRDRKGCANLTKTIDEAEQNLTADDAYKASSS
jgi:hypothetical protein